MSTLHTSQSSAVSRNGFAVGHRVLGPIIGEFTLRLWNLAAMVDRPDEATMLFCARGGLRMLDAYDAFRESAGLDSPVRTEPLMVSRIVALRAAIAPALRAATPFGPAATATLHYEFEKRPLSEALRALSGVELTPALHDNRQPATPAAVRAALGSEEALVARAEIIRQADLFQQHLDTVRGSASTVILVDTGLYGTTGQLIAEARPDLSVSTALVARSFRPLRGAPDVPAFGLSVQSRGYSSAARRTALLRYWHFVEWLFEPALKSVRSFEPTELGPKSNLESDGWRERVSPPDGSPWHGALTYLQTLPAGAAATVIADAEYAWRQWRRAVVWPTALDASALEVGPRSHDLGLEGTWSARPWTGAIAALRGSTMWREGEIAASGTPLRLPLLACIEAAYNVRRVLHALREK